jgi:hypothetical protein
LQAHGASRQADSRPLACTSGQPCQALTTAAAATTTTASTAIDHAAPTTTDCSHTGGCNSGVRFTKLQAKQGGNDSPETRRILDRLARPQTS